MEACEKAGTNPSICNNLNFHNLNDKYDNYTLPKSGKMNVACVWSEGQCKAKHGEVADADAATATTYEEECAKLIGNFKNPTSTIQPKMGDLKTLCTKCMTQIGKDEKWDDNTGEIKCPSCVYRVDSKKDGIVDNNTPTTFGIKGCDGIYDKFELFNIEDLLTKQKKDYNIYEIDMNDDIKPVLIKELILVTDGKIKRLNEKYSLDPDKFENFMSIKLNIKLNDSNDYKILKTNAREVHTICSEGNLVRVNNQSLVASGVMTSCLFGIILLKNDHKICFHTGKGHIDDRRSKDILGGKVDNNSQTYLKKLVDSIKTDIKKVFLFAGDRSYNDYIIDIFTSVDDTKIVKNDYDSFDTGNGLHIFTKDNMILYMTDEFTDEKKLTDLNIPSEYPWVLNLIKEKSTYRKSFYALKYFFDTDNPKNFENFKTYISDMGDDSYPTMKLNWVNDPHINPPDDDGKGTGKFEKTTPPSPSP